VIRIQVKVEVSVRVWVRLSVFQGFMWQ